MFSVFRVVAPATVLRWAGVVACAVGLAACNNSGSDNSGGNSTTPPAGATYTVGGTASGVTNSGLVLSNNGTTLPVGSGATTFAFTSGLPTGTSYNVMVLSAPPGLLCAVANGAGTIGTANVTNISVTCSAQSHALGGTISGLNADGLVLANNGSSVTVNSGATQFAFPTLLPAGTPYSVSVQTAPSGYTCSVANGIGTMGTADISNVVVTCSTQAYTVGGTINGYTTSGLVLANGTSRIALPTGATSFTMPVAVANTGSYAITIAAQPVGMSCSIRNGTGTVQNANVTNVAITCSNQSYTLGGTVTGLTVSGLSLTDGTDTVTVAVNATGFTFPTSLAFGASYTVAVATQPAGLTCTVSGGTGTMPAGNINNVAVTCGPTTYTLGGSISGLTVAGLVLANGTDNVTVAANATTFVFPTALPATASYTVTVSTQPNGYMCTVSGGTGTMPAANVTSVQVTCAVTTYTLGGSVSGLTLSGLVLANGTDTLSVAANATMFTMPTGVVPNSTYAVTVQAHPFNTTCTVTNGTGTMPASNVSNVQVACAPNAWTWVTGSSTAGALGVYNGTAPPQTPGARDSEMTWKDAAGNFWLFGGEGTDSSSNFGAFNDVWEYNTGTGQWTYVEGAGTVNQATSPNAFPGGREAGMVWADGAGNVWLFGGIGVDSGGNPGALSDLWKFNTINGQWTFVGGSTLGNQAGSYGASFSATNWPPGRGAASTWTDSGGHLWMFGGSDNNANMYNDVWEFDPTLGTSGEWAWMGGANTPNSAGSYGMPGVGSTNNIPPARYGALTWQAGGKIWLFGGAQLDASAPSGQDFFNDLWMFDPPTGSWTWQAGNNGIILAPSRGGTYAGGTYGSQGMPASNNLPGARGGAVQWTDAAGNLWLFGGFGYDASSNQHALNDLWVYSTNTHLWTWIDGSNSISASIPGTNGVYGTQGVAAAGNQPGGRFAVSGWTDSSGNFWLFGGEGMDSSGTAPGDLNDLWMYQAP